MSNIENKTLIDYSDEKWREIAEFPGYWVSDFGRIKSDRNEDNPGKILKFFPITKFGDLGVNLTRKEPGQKSERKLMLVRRIVAEAWLEKPADFNEKYGVSHIDKDKTNLRADNLIWKSEKEWRKDKTHRRIVQLTKNYEFVAEYESIHRIKDFDRHFFSTNVQSCCAGRIKTYKKYRWMYAEDYEKMLVDRQKEDADNQ